MESVGVKDWLRVNWKNVLFFAALLCIFGPNAELSGTISIGQYTFELILLSLPRDIGVAILAAFAFKFLEERHRHRQTP